MKNKKKIIAAGILAAVVIIAALIFAVGSHGKENPDINVPNYYSMSEFNFDSDFDTFRKDSYEWYKQIEDKDGVYIIHTSFYDSDVLDVWRENGLYNSVPNKPFWYFTASPSYLKEMGIVLRDNEISNAKNGTRLYLIPDSLSDEDAEMMESYLKEEAPEHIETSKIKTAFTDNPEVKVIRYTPKGAYFTWPGEKGEKAEDSAPVIYVCTSENMKYFENESLIATGLDSYIKFKNMPYAEKYLKNSAMLKYNSKFASARDIYADAAQQRRIDKSLVKLFE